MPLVVVCAVFLASGAAALVFETAWFFQAGLGFGNGIVASSLVLAGFMGGMALGAVLAARYVERVRNPFKTYAALEIAVAVTGVGLTYVLPDVHRFFGVLSGDSAGLSGVRFIVAFSMLCVPSTAIGMTLPVLARAVSSRDENFGRVLGLLYGVNTAGAVLGTLATEHVLFEALGVRGSGWFAGALHVTAAAVAFRYGKGVPDATTQGQADGAQAAILVVESRGARAQLPWLGAAFASGFVILGLEVVWLRFLGMFLNDTPLAFATILALVLAGVAAGSLGMSAWCARSEHAESLAPLAAYVTGVFCLGGYLAYPSFIQRYVASRQDGTTVLLVALPLVFPACLASGALYTALGVGLRRVATSHGAAAGRLSFASTLGSMLGPLAAGFVVLPRFGMERTLFGAIVAYGLIGAALSLTAPLRRRVALGAAIAFGLALFAFPFGFVQKEYLRASIARWMRPGDTVAAVREGLSSTVVHVVHRLHGAPLFDQVATNSYSMTVNDWAGRRYMKLFVALPSALHPGLRRAMVVGYGIGNTVEALTDDPELERIDVADVSRDLLDVSRGVQTNSKGHPLDDPRVHLHVEDGRYYLATTNDTYDLVTGEPPPPVVAGVVPLYTQEYFELVRERLAPGGMASYWLPLMNISEGTAKSIVRAFCAAFADCSLWQGADRNFMLLGTKDAKGPVLEARFARLLQGKVGKALREVGVEERGQLGALFIGDSAYLEGLTEGALPLTDDRPKRIQQEGTEEARKALVAEFADTKKARERFAVSPFVAAHFPESVAKESLRAFEDQRLIDDLMLPSPRWGRNTRVLDHVLRGTPLELPVLLVLKSSPDARRALSRLPPGEQNEPKWASHRLADRMARRDFQGAEATLAEMPPEQDALPDLRQYVRAMSRAPR